MKKTKPKPTTGNGEIVPIRCTYTELRAVSALKPHPRNPNKHPEEQIALFARILKHQGVRRAVVISKRSGFVVAGHGLIEAAKVAGLARLPVDVQDFKTEADEWAHLVADNRLAELSELSRSELSDLVNDLGAADFDLTLTALAENEIKAFQKFRVQSDDNDSDDDHAVELLDVASKLKTKWKIERGQIWQLGEHRLLCGDSTSKADVERLCAGQKAKVCVTDPPYSVNYEESHLKRGGDKTVHAHYQEADLDPTAILGFLAHLPADLILFSYSINKHFFVLADCLRQHGWALEKEIIWVKSNFAFWAGAAYQQKHEPIWICSRKGRGFKDNVPPDEPSVLEYAKPTAHSMHPTAKPLDLWVRLIRNHSDAGDLVYEPFSGSGTSIIACEKFQRRCLAIELSEEYCAVAIQRWTDLTQGKPKLL